MEQLGTIVLNHTVDELVALAEGASVLDPRVQREGVVLRPLVEEHDDEIGGRLSFKAINPKFLLKYDECGTEKSKKVDAAHDPKSPFSLELLFALRKIA